MFNLTFKPILQSVWWFFSTKLRIFVKSFFCLTIITFGGKPNILRVSGKQTWKHKQVQGCQMAIQYLFKRLKDVALDRESWCDNISFEKLLEEKFLITNWDFLELDIRFIIQQFYASTNLISLIIFDFDVGVDENFFQSLRELKLIVRNWIFKLSSLTPL